MLNASIYVNDLLSASVGLARLRFTARNLASGMAAGSRLTACQATSSRGQAISRLQKV